MLKRSALADFVVLHPQAVQEVGIDIAPIFVYQQVALVTGHRIIVRLLAVGFLQDLR